ncbi:uncharacterized protein LOC113231033 [Hyposmocoma kahamanoa]|uniref:uncharacterized protein LOC113231033 n=1 Tax=Hyposmocoma kahamanoa TaxID=1477025 RepID=UPI000E6D75BE|nr:uncharacterized protein LOC113231033 [Hyposmocoma kahamanoa]
MCISKYVPMEEEEASMPGDSFPNVNSVKYELHIECPNEDTSELEEALKKTKHVNWDRILGILLFPPLHAVECIKGVVKDIGKEITKINLVNFYVLDRRTPLFDVDLLPGFTFQQLSQKHIEIADSTWPLRYPGSIFYFELLIRANSGYGLFKDQELVSFGFIKETGALGHLYTLENQRRKGYGYMFLKMFCNVLLKEGRHINSYCFNTNAPACRMHEEFGFKKCGEIALVNIQ